MTTEVREAGLNLEPSILLEMFRRMWLIRSFDHAATKLLQAGKIPGVIHLTLGQEGAAVGACMALAENDYVVGNHRSHGHAIARRANVAGLMAELLGKSTGVCKGKGGSQHVADASVGMLLSSAVLGSAVPVAVGIALGIKLRDTGQVCICFFGDGAANEGAVHESMNLAAIWGVPLIFFCENNGYAVTVPATYSLSVEDVATRAAGYAMPSEVVDGQDAVKVFEAVGRAAHRARDGDGPTLVEAKTYRVCDHAENLPTQPYRPRDEVERWRERDPIGILRSRLLNEGLTNKAELDQLELEVRATIADAVQFAESSPFPALEALFEDLFVDDLIARAKPAGSERHVA